MSIVTYDTYLSLAEDVAKNAKIDTYGLIKKDNWQSCILRFMIIKALEYNDNLDVLSKEDIDCFKSYLLGNNNVSCGCLT